MRIPHLLMPAFRRYFLVLFGLSLLLVLSASLATYSVYARRTTEQVLGVSQAMLQQLARSAELAQSQLATVSDQLLSDNRVIGVLESSERRFLAEYVVFRRMSEVIAAYPFVHSITLYNPQTQALVSTAALDREAEERVFRQMQLSALTGHNLVIPRETRVLRASSEETVPVVTLLHSLGGSRRSSSNSAVMVNTHVSYLEESLRGLTTNQIGELLVTDNRGRAIVSTGTQAFLSSAAWDGTAENLVESAQQTGHTRYDDLTQEQEYLVAFHRSTKLGWTFLSRRSVDQVLLPVAQVRTSVLLILLLLVLVGGTAAHFLSRLLYLPLQRIVDSIGAPTPSRTDRSELGDEYALISRAIGASRTQIHTLENSLSEVHRVVDEYKLRSLLVHNRAISDEQEEQCSVLPTRLSSLRVVLVELILPLAPLSERNRVVREVEAELSPLFFTRGVGINERTGALIVGRTENLPSADSFRKDKLPDLSWLTVPDRARVSIGDAVSTAASLHISFQSARSYAQYSAFAGCALPLGASQVTQRLESSLRYPDELEHDILRAIVGFDEAHIGQAVHSFLSAINESSYEHGMLCVRQLVFSLYRRLPSAWDHDEPIPSEVWQTVAQANSACTPESLHCAVRDYAMAVAERLSASRHDQSRLVVERVHEHMTQHLSDPSLSAAVVAELVHLSPKYFQRLFRQVTGTSYGVALQRLRLQTARDLLTSYSYPVRDIARMVGIPNASYFTTVFKQEHGVTPNQFRRTAETP